MATALGKHMKLSEAQTLTGNITLSHGNTYTFSGALPSEIGNLSGVTSRTQTQLNKCITSNPPNFPHSHEMGTLKQLPISSLLSVDVCQPTLQAPYFL